MHTKDMYGSSTRYFLRPVAKLLDDPDVSEIMINGGPVYFESEGRLHLFDGRFDDEGALLAAARNIAEFANRCLDDDHHSIDARLPDGSRVHVLVPPASRQGVVITIRKFRKASFDLGTLVQYGSLTDECAEFLRIAVRLHKNILISGGTGSGKTSLLNALSGAIPETERIVVIEDTSELQLAQPHTLYLEAQPPRPDGRGQVTIRDLFVDSLRMRPDRIVVGEVRRGEALDLVQSMISGHAGSLSTLHANSARDAVMRLETLCLMSDVSLPVPVARSQVASAVDLIVQISRMSDGARRLRGISEVVGLDEHGHYSINDLYRFYAEARREDARVTGTLKRVASSVSFAHEPYLTGLGADVQLTRGLFTEEEGGARND